MRESRRAIKEERAHLRLKVVDLQQDVARLIDEKAELQRQLDQVTKITPDMERRMREMGREMAEQVGLDPDNLAMGVAVGPNGPVPFRLDS